MRTNLIFLAIYLAMLFACEKDDTIDYSMNTLEADAGSLNDVQLFIGQLLTLNGSQSKDKAGKPFQYLWSFKNKPATSACEWENQTTATPKFTPDKAGNYVVELKIYNQSFFDTDEISLSVKEIDDHHLDETIILDEDINVDTHLVNIFEDNTKIDYLVTGDIHVKAALTIDPSVTVAFETDKGMFIDSPGSIQGIGSPEAQIVFTGKVKTPGYWKGLIIKSNTTSNILERTTIEYGGSSAADGIDFASALVVGNSNSSNLTLANSTIQYSAGYGLVVDGGGNLNLPLGNTFNNNEKIMVLPASQLGSLNGLMEFMDNVNNTIHVIGDRVNMSEISHWIPLRSGNAQVENTISYVVEGNIEIASGVHIYEGVEFLFEHNAEVLVTPTGFMTAIGSPQNPIKFHGTQTMVDGFWNGISIKSNKENNVLKHVEIFDAGNAIIDGFATKTAIGLYGKANARLKISNSIISGSGGNGLLVENGAKIDSFGFIKFIDNKGPAVTLPANEIAKLGQAPALQFTGNGHDGVEIFGSILLNQTESVWPALNFGATYLISGNLSIQSGLKILPGAVFKLAEDKMIGIFPNGYLEAKGTDVQKIVFTGMKETKGFWNGIRFQSKSPKNVMDFTEVSYAGKTDMPGISQITAIGLDGNYLANLTITNSKITHGLGYGIVLEDDRAIINSNVETTNQFEDLSLGNVHR
ncbi:PKD domain-containing protein [Kriegella aquimaris]|uniref:PKD domain-containing protein n=1 Tax=Kriegella aquimaris TaxID=192904 RepID=A0A1G9S863_9FLAO|nr:hypothetical protein [Kriegella aquimaris]SDM31668.1 hypothetical protein SAMN04488514_107157 [Kriegella aquimaris]